MGIAFLPLYIKYLGLEAYGLIGIFALMQGWLALLDMGMTPTISREMARFTAGDHPLQFLGDLLRAFEVLCLGMGLCIGFGTWVAADWLAGDWLKAERLPVAEVAQAIVLMGWVVALRLLEGLYRGAVVGLQRQVWLNGASVVLATARWAGAVVLLMYVPTVAAFFIWQGIVSAISAAVFGIFVRRCLPPLPPGPRISLPALNQVKGFTTGMMATTLLAILLTQVDKLLLSRLLSLSDFARYTFAATVAGALLQLVMPISQAYLPRMTELAGREDGSGATLYHRGAQLISALILPPALMMVFFGEALLRIWTGNADMAAHADLLLALLAVGMLLNGWMYMPYIGHLARGWSGFVAKMNLVAVIFFAPAVAWGAFEFGALGAAGAWIALNLGYIAIGAPLMLRQTLPGETGAWLVKDLLLPAGACALLLGGVKILLTLCTVEESLPVLCLVGVLGAGVTIIAAETTRGDLVKCLTPLRLRVGG